MGRFFLTQHDHNPALLFLPPLFYLHNQQFVVCLEPHHPIQLAYFESNELLPDLLNHAMDLPKHSFLLQKQDKGLKVHYQHSAQYVQINFHLHDQHELLNINASNNEILFVRNLTCGRSLPPNLNNGLVRYERHLYKFFCKYKQLHVANVQSNSSNLQTYNPNNLSCSCLCDKLLQTKIRFALP